MLGQEDHEGSRLDQELPSSREEATATRSPPLAVGSLEVVMGFWTWTARHGSGFLKETWREMQEAL